MSLEKFQEGSAAYGLSTSLMLASSHSTSNPGGAARKTIIADLVAIYWGAWV